MGGETTIRLILRGRAIEVQDYETAMMLVRRSWGDTTSFYVGQWERLAPGKDRLEVRVRDVFGAYRSAASLIRLRHKADEDQTVLEAFA